MTRIIAILFVVGQFQVAVETSKGYFLRTYPDTETGVNQFVGEVRNALAAETGRFYTCVAYYGSAKDLLQSPLAERIGLAQNLRTGLRDPGIVDAPWIVRDDRIKTYRASHPREKLEAKLVEKMCLSSLPPNYRQLYPARAHMREFYRATE
jgi:hypothetical protein